jgi:hypothetical protein
MLASDGRADLAERRGWRAALGPPGAGSAYVEDVTPDGRTVLFRRDQGLWVKRIGWGRARKLSEPPDGSQTNAVFSSDGRRVAAFIEAEERVQLTSIDVASRSGRAEAPRTEPRSAFAPHSGTNSERELEEVVFGPSAGSD